MSDDDMKRAFYGRGSENDLVPAKAESKRMSGKIEISRELAHKLARNLWAGEEAYSAMSDLCKVLAAPVVERQPVVLPERNITDSFLEEDNFYADGWNACLDKIKELNQ